MQREEARAHRSIESAQLSSPNSTGSGADEKLSLVSTSLVRWGHAPSGGVSHVPRTSQMYRERSDSDVPGHNTTE